MNSNAGDANRIVCGGGRGREQTAARDSHGNALMGNQWWTEGAEERFPVEMLILSACFGLSFTR